ncbi:hypothetical protein BBO99_00005374 [Phytophthora kernoviae]|uniref:Uncharacterized protein n=2 Tax=Phytophthora kernoviae TaxID=325452 RepID=A0A3R7GW72_9STRA|nr:hypothetical protein G195_010418 [Phytophthora kernoviae 00238/432]KAG2524049.1 hypothetical protein JM16_005131 [Phytophthora kernoviae]KAG2525927.1 hypothetical protein JM18_004626 [Phytophthora kernoviae]RLN37229.1 hypothetical protein BBI17_005318 [Phytophthora kernoviae]RLN79291.1 hypothetical protein BBO99_00005374 [Phytophthora kernoviae]
MLKKTGKDADMQALNCLTQLSTVNRSLQHEITDCSKLWGLLVARQFGYVDNSPPGRRIKSNRNAQEKVKLRAISWKAVFIAAWRDSLELASTSLQENDVVQIYHKQKNCPELHQSLEAQIREELLLMQGLRKFPTSVDLVHLYAQVIRQAHFVPRASAANTASALRRLAI